VVVFNLDGDILVKRVAALGGQVIPVKRERVVLQASHKRPGWWEAAVLPEAPRQVPPGQIYVLGDNPPVSDDSRSFGPVPVSALMGRVLRWKDPGPPASVGQDIERDISLR
jgi:signal peptidase I